MQTPSDIREPDTPPPASQTAGSEPGARRRRSVPEERPALLDELEAGGLSAREFARHRDIGYQTLLSWRRKRREKGPERAGTAPGFAELVLPGAAPPPGTASLRIALPGGASLEIPGRAQLPMAAELLSLLAKC